MKHLPAAFWWVVVAGAVFTLARFSEAYLLLRAQAQGLPDAFAPIVLVLMNARFALTAYPMGRLADSRKPVHLLAAGLFVLIAADVTLALSPNLATTAVGVALWGLHMGMTQGVLAALVARSAPPTFRGTAFGVFYLASGFAMLIASVVAGFVWDRFGAPATFYTGAAFALAAFMLFLVRESRMTERAA